MNPPRPIAEGRGIDRATFEREIVAGHEPFVMRGLVGDWPLVARAGQSAAALCAHLVESSSRAEVDALMVPPGQSGRIGFSDDGQGFNYVRNRLPLAQVVDQVLRYAQFERPPAVAVQSALVELCAPGLLPARAMPLLDTTVAPRLWFGNAIVTPTHFDESSNIACVAAGERRFTLFPPEQIGNLYVGPIGHSPTGTPISLVDADQPDIVRFPRFAVALAAARRAVLEPGDAIYIPPLWWHHVASRKPVNLLINYWWQSRPVPSGLDLLLHTMLALKDLPPPQRRAWRALLDHWVFEADEATVSHIWPAQRGVHDPISPARAAQIRAFLRQQLGD